MRPRQADTTAGLILLQLAEMCRRRMQPTDLSNQQRDRFHAFLLDLKWTMDTHRATPVEDQARHRLTVALRYGFTKTHQRDVETVRAFLKRQGVV